jgi:hypothetical protein
MTAPTQFSPAQLAVLAEARALGGWKVLLHGGVRRIVPWPECPLGAVPYAMTRLNHGERLGIIHAADRPTDPRRPALLAALGMEVTS